MRLILLVLLLTAFAASAQREGFKVFGDSLEVYNAFTFSPDGKKLYTSEFTRITTPEGEPDVERWGDRNRPKVTLYEYDLIEGNPKNKRKLAFANDSLDSSPHLNFRGDKLYFSSRRPLPGADSLDGKAHVWFSEKQTNGEWSEANCFEEINEAGYYTMYAQELADGSIMYQSNVPGSVKNESGENSQDFWISEFKNGTYQEPQNVTSLNTGIQEDQLVVNRKNNLIIFTRNNDSEMYAFYSLKVNGVWNEPKELFLTDLPGFKEQSPRLSPDGQTFYFAHGLLVMSIPLAELLSEEDIKLIE
ncbi:MAG: hypothetical protein RJQ09_12915 [Cyclobacteriaceae bacterium]